MSHLEILNTEKEIHNLTFWNSEKAIERYCQSILNYCNQKNKIVSIVLTKGAQPRCDFNGTTSNGITRYEIVLPTVEYSLLTTRQEMHRITTKMFVFLRHELAHVLYSFDNIEKIYTTYRPSADLKSLVNAFEDSRIENLFGNAFHGTNDYFFYVRKFFWKTEKAAIESAKPNINHYGLYFIYRFKKLSFAATPTTEFYKEIYNTTIGEFLQCVDNESLFALASKIQNQYFSKPKQQEQQEEQKQTSPAQANAPQSEEQEQQEEQEQASTPQEQQEQETPEQELNEQNSEGEPVGEQEDAFDFEDSEEQIEQEIEDAFSDTQSNVEREIFDGDKSDAPQISAEEKGEIRDNQYTGLRSKINLELINQIVKNTITSDSSELVMFNAYLPEIVRYLDIVEKKNALKYYEEVVRSNNKTIAEAVNYLKLKFQSRIKKSIKDNRIDGIIDNRNIYKVLIKNDGDYKIFYNTLKDIQTNAEAVLLFDFSGSMSSNLDTVFKTMIIFSEVLNKLAIKHSIYGYAGTNSFDFVTKGGVPKVFQEKRLDVAKRVFGREYVKFLSGDIRVSGYNYDKRGKNIAVGFSGATRKNGTLVCFRDAKTVHADWKMTAGCSALDKRFRRSFTGSTPEFQAVIALRDKYKHLNIKNKLMFLFNDGGYDKIKLNNFLPKEVNEFSQDSEALETFVEAICKMNVAGDFQAEGHFYYKSAPLMSNAVCDAIDHVITVLKKDSNAEALLKGEPFFTYLEGLKADVRKKYVDGKYLKIQDGIVFVTPQFVDACSKNIILERFYYSIRKILGEYFKSYVEGDSVYSAIINDMRENGWIFSGFGIGCNGGINYIGEKNFQVISSRQITEKMVEKIKAVL